MGEETATAVAVELVEVIAPATLQSGFTFQAIYNGVIFPVTVPAGGVKDGEKMTVPFTPVVSELTPLVSGADNNAPRGQWNSGLCDFCKFGACHASLLNACCFPQILMAQVLTRLKMNLLASPGEYKHNFGYMVFIVVCYWILSSVFAPPMPAYSSDKHGSVTRINDDDFPVWKSVMYNIITTAFTIYTLFLLMKLRNHVRKRYGIQEKRCHGCEDFCCAICCGCCTVAQIARQTADYDQKRAVCCSETGLPVTSPAITV